MRVVSVCAAAVALGLAMTGHAAASGSARIVTFDGAAPATETQAAEAQAAPRSGEVRVLYGAPFVRKVAEPAQAMGPGRWQALAGRNLWLADLAGGEVVTCRLFRTTQVRQRVVRCFEGDLPRSIAAD